MNININLSPLHFNCWKEKIFEKICIYLEKKDFTFLNTSYSV